MKTALETLPDNTEILKNLLLSERTISHQKDAQIDQLKQQYQQILEQWRLSQDKHFGKSSEVSHDQLGLFNEVEQLLEEISNEVTEQETVTYSRKKPKRRPLPKDLPRETVVHDIDDADKVCGGCGNDLHKMGEAKSEQLEFIPAQIKVIEHVRPKYSCRYCEQQGTEVKVKIAPVPASAVPKSMATASLLSFIISNKYQYALPLYRQESLFKQYGIELSRQTMASWMLKLTPLLMRLYKRYQQILLQQSIIHADETPLKVINEDKVTSYMWVYCTGSDSPNTDSDKNKPPNLVLYDYQSSRTGQCARDYLNGYSGYLQVDGYAGYEQSDATLVGCWAHARRKFIEA